jgi:2-oxoglutarate ferredoxin oxidoreductase subunit alpha
LPTKVSQSDVMQARWGTHGDHATIAYAPSSAQECYDLAIKAFNMAERFRQPVLIMADEVIGHMRERIVVPDESSLEIIDRKKPACRHEEFIPYLASPADDVPPMAAFGDGYRWHVTGLTSNDWGFPTNNASDIEKKNARLLRKVDRFRDEVVEYNAENCEDAEILVVSYGCVARSALRAVRELRSRGLKVGHFRPVAIWPFPDVELEKLADSGVSRIIVPELNMGQMFLEVDRAVHGKAEVISRTLLNGELFKPLQIMSYIEEVA